MPDRALRRFIVYLVLLTFIAFESMNARQGIKTLKTPTCYFSPFVGLNQ